MKYRTHTTALLSACLLVASALLLWLALTLFGRHTNAVSILSQNIPLDILATPVVASEEEYALYPVGTVNYGIPRDSAVLGYALPAKDATVLAAKQVSELFGYDLSGTHPEMILSAYNGLTWEAFFPNESEKTSDAPSYYYAIDAVSGALMSFIDTQKSFAEAVLITEEQKQLCNERAVAIARQFFSNNLAEIAFYASCYSNAPYAHQIPYYCVLVTTGQYRYAAFYFATQDLSVVGGELTGISIGDDPNTWLDMNEKIYNQQHLTVP